MTDPNKPNTPAEPAFESSMDAERIEELKAEDRAEAYANRMREREDDDEYGLGDSWR